MNIWDEMFHYSKDKWKKQYLCFCIPTNKYIAESPLRSQKYQVI